MSFLPILDERRRHLRYPKQLFENLESKFYSNPPAQNNQHDGWVTARFSPHDENILFLGDDPGNIGIFNVDKLYDNSVPLEERQLHFFAAHDGAIMDIVGVPNKPSSIVSISGDATIRCWDVNRADDNQTSDFFQGHEGSVTSLSFAPDDSNVFASGSRVGQVKIWDMRVSACRKNDKLSRSAIITYKAANPVIPEKSATPRTKQKNKTATGTSVTSVIFLNEFKVASASSSAGICYMSLANPKNRSAAAFSFCTLGEYIRTISSKLRNNSFLLKSGRSMYSSLFTFNFIDFDPRSLLILTEQIVGVYSVCPRESLTVMKSVVKDFEIQVKKKGMLNHLRDMWNVVKELLDDDRNTTFRAKLDQFYEDLSVLQPFDSSIIQKLKKELIEDLDVRIEKLGTKLTTSLLSESPFSGPEIQKVTVFIGFLNRQASTFDIKSFFRGYGKIGSIKKKKGFGFVDFDTVQNASDAIRNLDGSFLCGKQVKLEFANKLKCRNSSKNIVSTRFARPYSTRFRMVIENLSTRYTWQEIKDHIRRMGIEPTYSEAHKKTVNEALICFSSHDDLRRAMDKLHGKELNGRKLRCIDDTQESRSRSRSRSRDRRRSRSASRSRSPRSRSRSPPGRSRSRSASRFH